MVYRSHTKGSNAPTVNEEFLQWAATAYRSSEPVANLACPMRRAKLTSSAAVEEVDAKPNRQPDKEAQPCHDRQPGHQQHAEENAEHRKYRPTRTAEAAMPMRIFVAQNQYAGGYQHKGKKRTDVGEIGKCPDVE